MNGILYLVATPIGNLEDITLRAIKILKSVNVIAAEDTRHTLKLLNHLEISKPLISYHRHNEEIKSGQIIEKLKNGENIALVSDAGTPVISDPGEEVVREALKEDIKIIPIPGACALVNALIASGLDTKEFIFYGFLSTNKKLKKEKLEEIKIERKTSIIYEAPHKLIDTLKCIKEIFGERKIVIAREITKIHEEFIRGTASEILEKYNEPRGEHIILIEGNKLEENKIKSIVNDMTLEEHYKYYEKKGLIKNEIIKKIAKDKNVSKNEVYKYFFNKKNNIKKMKYK